MGFIEISPWDFNTHPFSFVGKQKMLLSASDAHATNVMTVAWGGLGVMWGTPCAFFAIRPSRYTYTLAEAGEHFALMSLSAGYDGVGDCVMFAPNVTIATAAHPVSPALREKGYQYNLPVHIGRNCWLGAGVIVLPGVSIGENTIVGAGSVVTKDLPANVIAVGNPCRVLREITERDNEYYRNNVKIKL